jgi:hypothetical protein
LTRSMLTLRPTIEVFRKPHEKRRSETKSFRGISSDRFDVP